MIYSKKLFSIGAAALATTFAIATPAHADYVVAPNANETAEAGANQFYIFGNGSYTTYTFQTLYAASQFSSIPLGTQVSSIGYRADSTLVATVASDTNYLQYSIQIGQSNNGIGALSSIYADNLGADTILARSGPLTIPGGTFVGGGAPNPFFDLLFTTPYTYTGGNLLITINHTPVGMPVLPVDAVQIGVTTDTVGAGDNPVVGTAHFFNAPVIRIGFNTAGAAVPEPATWAMMILGFFAVGMALRAGRRSTSRTGRGARGTVGAASVGLAASIACASPAAAVSVTLGEQDFADGQSFNLTTYQAAAAGEPAPFDKDYGNDPGGTVFDQGFTFAFAPVPSVILASLTFGIWDSDSASPGTQVGLFTLNGIDLTVLANATFEADPAGQIINRIYTLSLPATTFASLAGGTAAFTLQLSGPSNDGFPGNGAGLDFATLDFDRGRNTAVPEPAAWLMMIVGFGFIGGAMRRRPNLAPSHA